MNFTVAQAFKAKIEQWPKIDSNDHQGLRLFSDFLVQCEVAARNNNSLKVLDDDLQNQAMTSKLPDWLISRWGRRVHAIYTSEGRFPPFREFVEFLAYESDIACSPITLSAKSSGNKGSTRSQQNGSNTAFGKVRSFNTCTLDRCIMCNDPNHTIDNCFELAKMPREDRRAFVMKSGLCFGCLKPGHMVNTCTARLRCTKCQKRHPTSMHIDDLNLSMQFDGESTGTDPKSTNDQKVSIQSHAISHFASCQRKSSMIVPVYLSSVENYQNEILVYALLDSQSDTSFISESICKRLGTKGEDATLRLSTMTAECNLVRSKRIGGLQVRGYDSNVQVTLPNLYTHEGIPCNRDSIPCASMTRDWPHLQRLNDKLMPKASCEVGLLLGYDCPQALAPRDVIAPEGNGPFAI